jgi:hypothetical protein
MEQDILPGMQENFPDKNPLLIGINRGWDIKYSQTARNGSPGASSCY